MKDKRNILKVACLINVIYIVLFIFFGFLFTKINDSMKVNYFIRLLELIPIIILYKQSKLDIKHIKNNKLPIIICGIWLLFDPLITGIMCFIFLSKIKDKNNKEIPKIEYEKSNKKDYVKSILAIIIFSIFYFVLSKLSLFEKIGDTYKYIILFIIVISINFEFLKRDFIVYKNNLSTYLKFIFKRYLIMLLCIFLIAIPIYLILGTETSSNQSLLNGFFKEAPIKMLLLTSLYAPLVEESIFRLDLRRVISNKTLFIIISGLVFGILHVVDYLPNIKDCLFLLVYVALGINLAKAYSDSNNIFVSISMHFIQNFLASIIIILTSI